MVDALLCLVRYVFGLANRKCRPQTVQLAPLINDVISTAGQLAEQNKNRLVVDAQEGLGALNAEISGGEVSF